MKKYCSGTLALPCQENIGQLHQHLSKKKEKANIECTKDDLDAKIIGSGGMPAGGRGNP